MPRPLLLSVALVMIGCGAADVHHAVSLQHDMDAYCTAKLNDSLSTLSAEDKKRQTDQAFFSSKLHTCVQVEVISDPKDAGAMNYLVSDLTYGFVAPPKWHHNASPLHVHKTVKLEPAQGAKFGYLTVLSGKAQSRKSRNVPLSQRSVAMLRNHGAAAKGYVFHRPDGSPWPNSHLGQQHARVRSLLKMPSDFVLHSFRHTFGTRLGESGADAFTIMRLMGHSTAFNGDSFSAVRPSVAGSARISV